MPKKNKIEKSMNQLVQKISAIAERFGDLSQQALKLYSVEVELIIREKDPNYKRIEHCLDGMLGFCFDDRMLSLYKKLCRYYYDINPEATVFYINSYREMWDEQESGDSRSE
jgi:hypothetical protein